MQSAHNEGMSVVAARFIRTLKAKIYKKMTANDNKSYLGYLNGLVGKQNNTYYCSFGKNHIDADCSAASEETKYKKFFTMATLKIAQEKYCYSFYDEN